MLAVIFLTGFVMGIVITTIIIYAYNVTIEMHENEVRQRRMEKQRRERMRMQQNEIRDELTRNICEEARKGIQKREEGGVEENVGKPDRYYFQRRAETNRTNR